MVGMTEDLLRKIKGGKIYYSQSKKREAHLSELYTQKPCAPESGSYIIYTNYIP